MTNNKCNKCESTDIQLVTHASGKFHDMVQCLGCGHTVTEFDWKRGE